MADLPLAWKVLNDRKCSWTCPLNYYLIHKEAVSYLSVSSKDPNVQFWNKTDLENTSTPRDYAEWTLDTCTA